MALTASIVGVEVIEDVSAHGGSAVEKVVSEVKARISLMGPSTHAEYSMKVSEGGNSWIVKKRFSEFATLHEFLISRFGRQLAMDLPAKTPIRFFSQDKLEDRKNSLNVYVRELCNPANSYIRLPEVLRFLNAQAGPTPGQDPYEASRTIAAQNPYEARAAASPFPAQAAAVPTRGYGSQSVPIAETVPIAGAPSAGAKVVGAAAGRRTRAESDDDDLVGWDK
eukprot:TRINITY_DN112386_c0_g1_i1.p1 TRINITY_DN112386_c0_g1~~TRINITY_DN112386_c0_g1_i1.p1  ORF type:complete len:223 (+),score=44.06 TRINITY_DN112386_c0_g1_i1:85-753(+)